MKNSYPAFAVNFMYLRLFVFKLHQKKKNQFCQILVFGKNSVKLYIAAENSTRYLPNTFINICTKLLFF